MKFTKMQGCGNDYIYVNGFTEHIPDKEKPEIVRKLSDRHFGIGGDGIIFINPGKAAEFEMEMYNADGSRAEMCGNGIRCVGKYVYDYGLTDKETVTVESFGKVKILEFTIEDGKVVKVRVDMNAPILVPEEVPVENTGKNEKGNGKEDLSESEAFISRDVNVDGHDYKITCVSMGNPHAVIFIDETDNIPDIDKMKIESFGPFFENHKIFPNRTNTEFVEVIDRGHIKMRVWERGTGETLACGTGCCACAVACILNGRTDNKVKVDVLGGSIDIEWDRGKNTVFMTGPAVTVFDGEI